MKQLKIPILTYIDVIVKELDITTTFQVKLDYFNGQTWISNKILIDTGASQIYCIPLPTAVLTASEYNFVTYNGQKATLNQISRIMMKTPNSTLLEFD